MCANHCIVLCVKVRYIRLTMKTLSTLFLCLFSVSAFAQSAPSGPKLCDVSYTPSKAVRELRRAGDSKRIAKAEVQMIWDSTFVGQHCLKDGVQVVKKLIRAEGKGSEFAPKVQDAYRSFMKFDLKSYDIDLLASVYLEFRKTESGEDSVILMNSIAAANLSHISIGMMMKTYPILRLKENSTPDAAKSLMIVSFAAKSDDDILAKAEEFNFLLDVAGGASATEEAQRRYKIRYNIKSL